MNIEKSYLETLLPEVKDVLFKSKEERIKFVQSEKWISYPKAQEILEKLKKLLFHPQKSRMPGMLLIGGTNNGKTSLVKKFVSDYKIKKDPLKYEATQIRIIYTIVPCKTDISSLYSNILESFAVPYRSTDKIVQKEKMIKNYIRACGAKMIVLDEIHNILSGSASKQREFMNGLKNLSNELQISIVLVGIKDALHATNTNAQINNRFKPSFLPKWQLDKNFISLLLSIEKTLPLKESSNFIENRQLALNIYDLSEGYIGELIDLIEEATIYAIENDIEKIDSDVLKNCGFVKASQRKNFSDLVDI